MGLIILLTNPFTFNEREITFSILNKNAPAPLKCNFQLLNAEEQMEHIEEQINYARELARHDDYDNAIDVINNAIALKPDYENVYNSLANIYLARASFKGLNNKNRVIHSEDFKKAIEYATLNSKTFPQSAKAYESLINIYIFVEDFEQGITVATNACYSNPGIKNNCYMVGDLYMKLGKKNQAIEFYLDLAKKSNFSDDDWIYNKLGFIYADEGACDLSNKYYKLAYQLHSSQKNLQNLTRPCQDKNVF